MTIEKLLKSQIDRVIAMVLAAASVIALLAGWLGVSRNAYVANQVSYLVSGAIAAVLLLGLAATLWISADLRDEWHKLDSIDQALRALAGTPLVPEIELLEAQDSDPTEVAAAVTSTNGNGVEPATTATTRRPRQLRATSIGPALESSA